MGEGSYLATELLINYVIPAFTVGFMSQGAKWEKEGGWWLRASEGIATDRTRW